MVVSETLPDRTKRNICSRCATEFVCGARAGAPNCWCAEIPPIQPGPEGSECMCRRCLSIAVTATPVEGIDYYLEGAAVVFTAHYHLRRGYCCGNGCRHCPYEAVQNSPLL